jgi:hypothetical protein
LNLDFLEGGKPSRVRVIRVSKKWYANHPIGRVGANVSVAASAPRARTGRACLLSRSPSTPICGERPSRDKAKDATNLSTAAVRQHLAARRNLFSISSLWPMTLERIGDEEGGRYVP